jgi:hypothetical protein
VDGVGRRRVDVLDYEREGGWLAMVGGGVGGSS